MGSKLHIVLCSQTAFSIFIHGDRKKWSDYL